MKNRVLRAILALGMVVAFSSNAMAVVDRTASVSATASISGVTTLGITPASIAFGNTAADAYPTTPTDRKVVITYSSNYNPWKLAIYTDNTQVADYTAGPPIDGSYQKGGLATANGKARVACKWVAKKPGNPAPLASAINDGGKDNTGYNFIKDKRDQDDPASAGADESWTFGFAAGYANVAWGNVAEGVCVDPTVYISAGHANNYKGDKVNGTIDVYIAALFGTGGDKAKPSPASAGDYSSSISFDLYHE